ncbi:MAG TPA: phosphoribosylanthranilate isomerase [Bacteroidia bacterium]|jgi:phosphoribosylanthranilate isomerase|nr:phosphoribosylanthranilate isomerase [Bacteroidia bacterium]
MNSLRIKICGMKYPDNMAQIAAVKPDYMGFIFYAGSPRYVGGDFNPESLNMLPASIKKTGVFVNQPLKEIQATGKQYHLDLIQLHGSETPEFCKEIRKDIPVIKAFGLDASFDFNRLQSYVGAVDYFLFDTRTTEHGGSGKKFDWDILKNYTMDIPFFLSGGIAPDDIMTIEKFRSEFPLLYGIDLNSRFEISPAVKDALLLKGLLEGMGR